MHQQRGDGLNDRGGNALSTDKGENEASGADQLPKEIEQLASKLRKVPVLDETDEDWNRVVDGTLAGVASWFGPSSSSLAKGLTDRVRLIREVGEELEQVAMELVPGNSLPATADDQVRQFLIDFVLPRDQSEDPPEREERPRERYVPAWAKWLKDGSGADEG